MMGCVCAQGQGLMVSLQSQLHPVYVLPGLIVVMLQAIKKTCMTHTNANIHRRMRYTTSMNANKCVTALFRAAAFIKMRP